MDPASILVAIQIGAGVGAVVLGIAAFITHRRRR